MISNKIISGLETVERRGFSIPFPERIKKGRELSH